MMRKGLKYALLVTPVLPLIILPAYFIFGSSIRTVNTTSTILVSLFLLCLFAYVLYVLHLVRNKQLSFAAKVNWGLAFLFFMTISQLFYWFKFVKNG
jgi:hypothetical protein